MGRGRGGRYTSKERYRRTDRPEPEGESDSDTNADKPQAFDSPSTMVPFQYVILCEQCETDPTPKVSLAPTTSFRQDKSAHEVVAMCKVVSITSWEYPLTRPTQPSAITAAPTHDDTPAPGVPVMVIGITRTNSRGYRCPGCLGVNVVANRRQRCSNSAVEFCAAARR